MFYVYFDYIVFAKEFNICIIILVVTDNNYNHGFLQIITPTIFNIVSIFFTKYKNSLTNEGGDRALKNKMICIVVKMLIPMFNAH